MSEGVRQRHPGIPWKGMTGVRDRLIHHYFGVSLEVVWGIVSDELDQVAFQVEGILRAMEEEEGIS